MKNFYIIVMLFMVFALSVVALDTGALSPGTMADNSSYGTVVWSNVDNAKTSNNGYASADLYTVPGMSVSDNSIKIVKGGIITGSERSLGIVLNSSDTYFTFGGNNSDLWGLTWTRDDINSATFGVAISYRATSTSHYLKATNFGFTIPAWSTIDGIKFEVEAKNRYAIGHGYADVDHMRLTVYYTEGEAPPDTCTPTENTSWEINCSDNCVIVGKNYQVRNITLSGTGTIRVDSSNITYDFKFREKTCTLARSKDSTFAGRMRPT